MAGEPMADEAARPKDGSSSPKGRAINGLGRWLMGVVGPWGVFLKVILDPYTFLLIVVGAVLGWFGPKAVGDNYNALLQIVVAVVTGVVGARISTAMAAINQDGKLYASGRMAVRGLRLILTKTLALERRVATFVAQSQEEKSAETRADVAKRNLDEVLESIRMLQSEVVGSIENWVDVVPDADVSKIFMAVGELRDQLTQKDEQLREAVKSKERLESKGETDTQALQQANGRIQELERDKTGLKSQISALKQAAAQGSNITSLKPLMTFADYVQHMEEERVKDMSSWTYQQWKADASAGGKAGSSSNGQQ